MTQDDTSREYTDAEICALIASLDLEHGQRTRSEHAQLPVASSGPPTYDSLTPTSSAGSAPPTYYSRDLPTIRSAHSIDSELARVNADAPRPPPATPSPPRGPTTIYAYWSPTQQGVTPDWHVPVAGSASQGIPNSSVHAVHKSKKSSTAKAAYVVFHGRRAGVYLTWDEASAAVTGSRGAIHRGYSTVERARAAFKYAEDRGWTRSSDLQSPASAISALPTPILISASDIPNPLHGEDNITNKWFVVYRGIMPGVYQSVLEMLLNTSGVRTALYEGIEGKSEAIRKYQDSVARGEVSVVLPTYHE